MAYYIILSRGRFARFPGKPGKVVELLTAMSREALVRAQMGVLCGKGEGGGVGRKGGWRAGVESSEDGWW
jgi:hypothetical protein